MYHQIQIVMSDQAKILDYLEQCKEAYSNKDFLNAAINAYWCVKYCEEGEPYCMPLEDFRRAETEAWQIMRTCSRKFKSSKLSKTTFVYGTICPKLLWLYKNKYNLRRVSRETQRKFDEGHIMGSLAQRLFPDGIDASDVDSERVIDMCRFYLPFNLKQQLWLNRTNEYYRDHTVYEAAFVYNDVFAAVDILTRGANGHVAYEVKCSRAVTDTFLKDCALQYYVISRNIALEDFFLIYVNERYLDEIQIPFREVNESNVDMERLFIKESVLSRILPLQEEIKSEIENCKSVLSQGEPSVEMGAQCTSPYECMFTHYCKNADRDFDIW